jgi:hypothetical protein
MMIILVSALFGLFYGNNGGISFPVDTAVRGKVAKPYDTAPVLAVRFAFNKTAPFKQFINNLDGQNLFTGF